MPIAPRQGRKGGKISSSPAIAPAVDSPGAISPGSLPPGGVSAALPTEPNTTLQFNIEALMGKKRRSPSKTKAAATAGAGPNESLSSTTPAAGSADANGSTISNNNNNNSSGESGNAASGSTANGAAATPATAAAAAAATTPATAPENSGNVTPAGADSNVFKFDLDAIAQVGQGVVFGGNKTMRTDFHKPSSDPIAVSKKLGEVIDSQNAAAAASEGNGGDRTTSPTASGVVAGLAEAASHQMVLLQRSFAALRLAVAVSRQGGEKVLVVVPHYSDVSDVAAALRAIGATCPVGELTGQSFSGETSTTLWVTDVDTALVYLTSQHGMAPFTHLVLPNMSRMSPLLSYFLWGLRERVYRQSANLDAAAPPLHLVVCVSGALTERMQAFFANQTVATLDAPPARPVTAFTYDEANALAEMDVLDVAIDESGKYPGPHRKIVDHSVQVAAAVVRRIFAAAPSCPQAIYILTGDSREMVEALHKEQLADTTIYAGRFPSKEDAGSATAARHRVCVLHSVMAFTNYNNEDATFVLDLGTTRRLALQNKSEGFMASSASEWASKADVAERRCMAGAVYPGAYIAVYPPAAEAVLPSAEAPQPTVYEVEDALLQCSRAQLPIEHANNEMVSPLDAESMDQVKHSLSEKCLIANLSDVSLTFAGEIASRLPLEVDLAHLVINCCALGHSEVGVVVAGVCALPYRFPSGESGEAFAAWKKNVLESRQEYAGEIANQSDLLADVLVFLEWWRLKASGAATQPLVSRLQVKEDRLEHIRTLITYLRVQISDYAFVDDLDDASTLAAVTQSIKTNASIFTFFETVALARRLFFVRDAGTINVKDRAGALLFVRTSKKVVPNSASPSSVAWESGAALVAVDLRNLASTITCARVSAVNNTYLFAALLLLYPQVEYSAPFEVPGKGTRVVFFGITCNRQMKRFRVSISEAAQILDFRERWNTTLGYLQALRTSKKPLSRRKFNFLLKEADRHFDLEELRGAVQRELQNLVTEIEVVEHQASFVTQGVHCLAPKQVLEPVDGVDASDVDVTKKFHDGELWATLASPAADTPATVTAVAGAAAMSATAQSPVLLFPTSAAATALIIDDDDDDEVEVMGDLYLNMNGPIIDDDDEE